MAYTIQFISGAITYTVQNYTNLIMRRILNDIGEFSFTIPSADPVIVAKLIADTEVMIDMGNHALYGFAKKVSWIDSINGLQIQGNSYAIALWDTYGDAADAYGNMDASSSGRIVLWTSKTPGAILYGTTGANGLLKNTIFTAPSGWSPAGTPGNQRFDNMKKGDIIKNLAKAAGTEWIDNTDKTFNFGNRIGLDTSVQTFRRGYNCTIIDKQDSGMDGNVHKVVVLGRGTGTNQIIATSTAADYNRANPLKNKERVYINNTITDETVAKKFSDEMLIQLSGGAYKTYIIQPINPDENVQLGDRILFIDSTGASHDMRIYEWKKNLTGGAKPTLTLQLIENIKRTGRLDLKSLINKYGNLTEIQGSTSQEKSILIGPVSQNASDLNRARISISLPVDVKSILSAKLYLTRQELVYDTGTSTENSMSNTSISNASAYTNASMTNGIKGSSDGGYSFGVYSSTLYGNNTWRNVGVYINTGTYTYLFHLICGSFRIEYAGNNTTIPQSIDIRAYNTVDGTYFPNSTGYRISSYFAEANIISTWILPFFMLIPRNWTNKQYYLQYKIQNQTNWSGVQNVEYSYGGTYGHTHPNTFNDVTHINANSLNDANHQNSIARNVYVPGGESNKTLGYSINGGAEISITNFAVNGDSGEIDIKSLLTTAASQYITVRPTATGAQARITTSIRITYI